jgi:gliding motility-associated-like protein
MKHLYLLLCLLAFTSFSTQAQLLPPDQPEQDACNALQICGNFASPYSYQGNGTILDLPTTDCGDGEANSVWFKLVVNTGGIIVFTITPFTSTDDYDFAIVDITNGNCNSLSISDVIRCNFNNNSPVFNGGVLGLNTTSTSTSTFAGATGGSYLQQITANPGDVYLIMINNFGSPGPGGVYLPSAGFTLDFTGTTATFNGPSPTMVGLVPSCNSAQQLTLIMSENILCNSIEPGGSDFTVTGGSGGTLSSAVGVNCSGTSGYTDKILLNFSSPLPAGTYNLVAQTGSDGNTLLNTCSHPLVLPASLSFIVPPYVPPAFVSIEPPSCSEIKIKMATRVRCDSIAKDGSDFSISGPQASSVIAAYGTGCDSLNFTDTIVLLLQSPLHTDGTYTVTAKNGTDGNTQMDSCGLHQAVGDAISFSLNSYDGQVVATPDTLLCNAQYLQLGANNFSPPPPMAMNCDTTATTCSGNIRVGYVGGEDTIAIGNTPFNGASDDQRAQYLFRASELRTSGLKAGSIRSLQLNVAQLASTQPYKNLTIKVGCTPLADIGSTFLTGPQIVYTNPSYPVVAGWNTFNLTTPYNWDGVSNLIVEICYDNTFPNASDAVVQSVTPFVSVLRRFGQGLSGCAITTQGTASAATNLRPKIRFSICEPPAGIPSYVWSPGLLLSDSTIHQPLAYINDNRTYHVVTFDKFGCAHRDSMTVTLSERTVSISPKDTTICVGNEVILNATGGINYNWIAADPATLSCISCPSTVATPLQTSTYSVVINDQHDCADTLNATVNVNPLPPVRIMPRDTVMKYNTYLQLLASGAQFYSWSPASYLTDPNIVNPLANLTVPVTFILSGIDENGCRNIDSIHVGVDYTDAVFVPSAFSPNGDGKNDIFKVGSISFQKVQEFRIFNRWGQEIFSTTDPKKGWDGTFNGQPQEMGVYNYIIRLAYPDGKIETYKGSVTLIR